MNGYSENTTEIIIASCRNSTLNKCNFLQQQWENLCRNVNINISITLKQGLDFLTHLFKKENKCLSIVFAQSVFSNLLPEYDGVYFGKNEHVKTFMKGIFDLKLSLPKYPKIKDIKQLCKHCRPLPDKYDLDLKTLTLIISPLFLFYSS